MDFPHRYGVEEEFFICDRAGEALSAMPPSFWRAAQESIPGVSKELLQSQIELQTDPCLSFGEGLAQLIERRALLGAAAARHGIRPMACGTHPTMDWRDAATSRGPRYSKLVRGMRMLAARNLYCGMHVHVETPPDVDRIRVINRCVPFLPLFLALSVSSPFWQGE
jgi:carboxylate-amine ligase